MTSLLPSSKVSEALSFIKDLIARADREFVWYRESEPEEDELVRLYVEQAFIEMLVLLEVTGLEETRRAVVTLKDKAEKNYIQSEFAHSIGEPYLVWSARLQQYVDAIEHTIGQAKVGVITKDVIQILRGTQYAITNELCFAYPPKCEDEVHVRIEAVLQCVFPDLLHKPAIAKPIKNFQPDTGLPSVRTLIEYKYLGNADDAKRIADEVLADTRGYVSTEWDNFIYVIYETKRIKREEQWEQLLRKSDVGSNTSVIVISGEDGTLSPKRRQARKPSAKRENLPRKRVPKSGKA